MLVTPNPKRLPRPVGNGGDVSEDKIPDFEPIVPRLLKKVSKRQEHERMAPTAYSGWMPGVSLELESKRKVRRSRHGSKTIRQNHWQFSVPKMGIKTVATLLLLSGILAYHFNFFQSKLSIPEDIISIQVTRVSKGTLFGKIIDKRWSRMNMSGKEEIVKRLEGYVALQDIRRLELMDMWDEPAVYPVCRREQCMNVVAFEDDPTAFSILAPMASGIFWL